MKNITIAGNVGKDAETRQTQNGNTVTSFSLAVQHFDGKEKSTIWFDVSCWGKRGDALAKMATKGARLVITGDFSTREYNGKTYLQVNANDFTPMGGGTRDSERQAGGDHGGASHRDDYFAPSNTRDLDDEIPF